MDKKLDFALSYNWWTPSEKRTGISDRARVEYIMKYGTFDELVYLFRNRDRGEIEWVFNAIQ